MTGYVVSRVFIFYNFFCLYIINADSSLLNKIINAINECITFIDTKNPNETCEMFETPSLIDQSERTNAAIEKYKSRIAHI